MKSYHEVVAWLGQAMFNSHMGGGSKRNPVINQIGLTSFIYDIPLNRVLEDADAAFRELNGGLD
jgi:hypothetical protein